MCVLCVYIYIYPYGSNCLLRKYLGYDLGGQVPSQTVFGSIGIYIYMWKDLTLPSISETFCSSMCSMSWMWDDANDNGKNNGDLVPAWQGQRYVLNGGWQMLNGVWNGMSTTSSTCSLPKRFDSQPHNYLKLVCSYLCRIYIYIYIYIYINM